MNNKKILTTIIRQQKNQINTQENTVLIPIHKTATILATSTTATIAISHQRGDWFDDFVSFLDLFITVSIAQIRQLQ